MDHVEKVMKAGNIPPSNDMYLAIENAVRSHHEMIAERNGRAFPATRLMQSFQNHGWFEAIVSLVSGNVRDGFRELCEAGRASDTFEALVVRFSDEFPPKVVDKARERLYTFS